MKLYTLITALTATLSATVVVAAPTSTTKRSTPGFVKVPFTKVKNPSAANRLIKRGTVTDTLTNGRSELSYFSNVEIGTPAQTFNVIIDTGSSDLWVYSQDSAGSGYVSSDSSTYQSTGESFSIEYVDGSTANGEYDLDTVTLGTGTVDGFQFAAVPYPSATGNNIGAAGIFGIAMEADESTSDEYPNWPVRLQQQGTIESTAYSVYLDDWDADTGVLLFGGIDTDKYTGDLYTVPIVDFVLDGTNYGKVSFTVDATVSANGGSASESFSGVLDTGTSLTYLPSSIVKTIAKDLGATYSSSYEAYIFESTPSSDIYVTYSFSGAEIKVPASELVLPASDLGITGDSTPILTIFPNSQADGYTLLGDTFLRSAYVVYDISNLQIGLAQSNWGSTSSNIVAIPSSGIPDSQSA